MGYIGAEPATSFEAVQKDRFTSTTGTTVTLSHTVSTVQDIVVWVNSVKQDYTNYSVNGTTLTLGGSLVSADIVEVVYVGRTLQTVAPATNMVTNAMMADDAIDSAEIADGSIDTAHIADDQVTYAKIQNVSATDKILGRDSSGAGVIEEISPANLRTMINVADGANAYTHPNHSGEVTSTADGATVIADNIVDEANLKISNSPTNGQFLSAQSGNTGGLTWATAGSDYVRIAENGGSSGTAGVNFDDVFDGSVYQHYRVIGFIAGAVNAGCDMYWRTGGASGSTYTTSDYTRVQSGRYIDNGGSVGDYNIGVYADSKFRIATDCKVDSNSAFTTFDLLIADPDTDIMSRSQITGTVGWYENTGHQQVTTSFSGRNASNVNATGLRFQMESNNITWRRIQLWGYKRA